MENIEFKRLPEVSPVDIIELMNHPKVRAQMPLTKDNFDENDCVEFISKKEALWKEHGFGPWAFFIGTRFIGWGGIQPEMGEVDLALVLHPNYWGFGKSIFHIILKKAFEDMGLDSVVILLPPTRTRIRAIYQLGFRKEKTIELNGEPFILFRLQSDVAQKKLFFKGG